MIASRDRVGAAGQRLLENPVGGVGADVEDRAHRLALHLRLVVVEQLGQVGQRFAAAELRASAESPSGARPDSASSSAARSSGGRPTPNASRIAVSRSRGRGALLDRQRLGERADEHLAERHAHRLHALELRLVDRRQVRRRCAASSSRRSAGRWRSSRAGGAPSTRCRRRRLRRPAPPPAAMAASKSPTSSRSSSSADDRLHQLAPALLVLLDSQQVEDQRQVERAQRRRRDRAEPRADPIRRVVVHLLDLDRLRARARQLAAVGVGDERSRRSTRSAAFRRRGSRPTRSLRCCRAATPRRRRAPASAAAAAVPARATSDWNASARRSVGALSEITWRATKRAIVVSVMRLTTACTSRGPSSSSRVPHQPEQHVGRALADCRRPCSAAPARADRDRSSTPLRRSRAACASARRLFGADAARPIAARLERRHQLGEPLAVARRCRAARECLPRRDRTRCPAGSWRSPCPRRRLRRPSARAGLRRSRSRAARRAGRPSSPRRARCRRPSGPSPAFSRAAAETSATPRRRRRDGPSARR